MLMSFRQHQRQRANCQCQKCWQFWAGRMKKKKKPTTLLGQTKRTRNSNYKAGKTKQKLVAETVNWKRVKAAVQIE